MGELKAIETVYGGCRFRSRREARWAVFFDFLGIKWDYEEEGFDLNGVWYLPDFWLPDLCVWLEVKGSPPSYDEQEKAAMLAQLGDPAFIFWWKFDQDTSANSIGFWKDEHGIFHSEEHWRFINWYEPSGSEIRIVNRDHDKWFAGETLPFAPGIDAAMKAARQARFEYGEQGYEQVTYQRSPAYSFASAGWGDRT